MLIVSVFIFGLSFLLLLYNSITQSPSHQVKRMEAYIQAIEKDFEKTLQDTVLINKLISTNADQREVQALYSKPYGFYIYREMQTGDHLRFWSTGKVLPSESLLKDRPERKMTLLPNGYYYAIKQNITTHPDFTAYCLVLIKWNFFIETEIFKNNFSFDPKAGKAVSLSFEATPYPVKSLQGNTIFYFKPALSGKASEDTPVTVLLRILGLFLIFFSLYLILTKRYTAWNSGKSILLFVACLLSFRILVFVMSYVFAWNHFQLFDKEIYSSSIFLPTLGDLLLNSVLFCWISVFLWNRISSWQVPVSKYTSLGSKLMGLGFILSLLLMTFGMGYLIRTIITDSKISFDVTNFFNLNLYTFIGFLIITCLSHGYFYCSRLLYKYAFAWYAQEKYLIYIFIGLTGLFIITVFINAHFVSYYLPVVIWLLLFTILFHFEKTIYSVIQSNISVTIFWIVFFSVSISLLMLKEIKKTEIALRKTYIEKLAVQTDPDNEKIIRIGNKYLDTTFFRQNFTRLYDEQQNQFLRDSIASKSTISYQSSYYTTLYFFDSLNQPLFNPDANTLAALNNIVIRQSRKTATPGLFLFEAGYDRLSYITQRVIKKPDGGLAGTVFVISHLKKFGKSSIVPELFRQRDEWELSNSAIYQYAVYKKGSLVSSSSKYPFSFYLFPSQIPVMRYEIRNRGAFTELWYHPDNSTVVVVTRKNEVFTEVVTLFSYIFCSFLLMMALVNILSLAIAALVRNPVLKAPQFLTHSIRGQIHNTLIVMISFSFIIIGGVTISLFTRRYATMNAERLTKSLDIVSKELQSTTQTLTNINLQPVKTDTVSGLQIIVKRLADVHGVDINVYELSGLLRASSQKDFYDMGIVSYQMSPQAFYNLSFLRHIEQIQQETISDLSYTSIYAPLRNKDGVAFAYLGIPYFSSEIELNQEISNFVVTLINFMAFVFLLTGLLTLFITNKITNSLTIISNKLKSVSLSASNDTIEWNRNDEIRELIQEYNKMVVKLRESADSLARNERELAWTAMARQVAHEIKNPLTPMKLSLQYLQKAINENSPNVQALTASVSTTLVEQIDYLSKIASDFSQFANIQNTTRELLDLHDIIRPLKDIYSANPKIELVWQPISDKLIIQADRTQMNRLFTNLLVNAVDACDAKEKCRIIITEKETENQALIVVEDNGAGISDEMKNKIFTPNFTTKTSGTGLGLAMCKTIVEQSGGSISFETERGRGTRFMVKLPKASPGATI